MALAFVAMMVFSVFGTGIAAAASPSENVSYSGDVTAPNPYFDVDALTVATHPMDEGASHADMAGYYDDSGNWVSDPRFEVNTTSDEETGDNVNPYSFNPTHVDADFYSKFPRTGTTDGEQDAAVVNAGEWTTDATASTGTISATDTEVAENVESVRISTTNESTGDVATASYGNWTSELDSDEEKRVFQTAFDVNSMDSGAVVYVNITDETGDYKSLRIDPSATNQSQSAAIMSTGQGAAVYQIKLSQLTTQGSGSFDNIEKIDVNVEDGNADVSFSWMDLEKKGKITLAEQKADTDGDGAFDDTETLYNATGDISTSSMTTLDTEYSSAAINDVSMPVTSHAKDIEGAEGDDGDFHFNWTSADDYPSFDWSFTAGYRMSLPNQIDLTYSGVDLKTEQGFVSDRYDVIGFEQGASSGTNFSEASLTDRSGSLGAPGDTVVLDSGVATGADYIVSFELKLTEGDRNALEDIGGGAAPPAQSDGGILNFLTSLPGMLLSGATAIFGFGKLRSRLSG